MSGMFVVARNPDPGSSLPFIVRLPVGGKVIVLKTREEWPRTSRVYCHPVEDGWPPDAEVIEEIPVRSCVRRGPAVDLVLDRSRENRSQFVWTATRGRSAVFWQSPKTTRKSRPGVRVPTRRAFGEADVAILVDSRERYAYKFSRHQVELERRALPAGDYGIELAGTVVAAVERKSVADLVHGLVDGKLMFQMAELAALARAAVVVEDRYGSLYKTEHVQAGWLVEVLARLQARYPAVPVVFSDTRALAEDWTYRFLVAARREIAGGDGELV